MKTEIYQLKCGSVTAGIITYGAALQSLIVPDRDGTGKDVVLGFETADGYAAHDKFMGATAGRFCNRIGGAEFEIDGKKYTLAANDGENHLHGGICGFDKKLWEVVEADDSHIVLSLHSPDGDEGYPGNLDVKVKYSLVPGNAGAPDAGDSGASLVIEYSAVTDAPTLCNLTNHAYYNLNGHDAGSILDQEILIEADEYTPADSGQIPDGSIVLVEGTPMDLRKSTPIGLHIDEDFDQLTFAGGYDRNWMIRGAAGQLRHAARAYSPASGIAVDVYTTQAAMQLYSGNFLNHDIGKGGTDYTWRSGFCLETQNVPDAIHSYEKVAEQAAAEGRDVPFPDPVLRPGMEYNEKTVYYYSVVK